MRKFYFTIFLIVFGFIVGVIIEKKASFISHARSIFKSNIAWDNTQKQHWDSSFRDVSIISSVDGIQQKAMFLGAKKRAPLVISLHTWSGDYKQYDPLAEKAKAAGWNYIHPDFRGPNKTESACLSDKVIPDIDDSISYAIENGNVDNNNIFVVGVSGGGYVTLGSFIKSKHSINTFMAWVPISDIALWYNQSKDRNSLYAKDIIACTGSDKLLDIEQANRRSPLLWPISRSDRKIEIYAGINDGHTGSVPISQSILFYNKLAKLYDQNKQVTAYESIMLLDRKVNKYQSDRYIGDRKLILSKAAGNASIFIFDGSHEMLPNYAFSRLESIVN